jgi:hypothetical protein
MASETESQASSRKQLLDSAMELTDAINRYLKLLGNDGGKAAKMSRSSHRDLFIEPAKRIHSAWRSAIADFRGTAVEAAFERARFVERTEALRPLTDRQDDHQAWDEAIDTLSADTKAFIDALVPPAVDKTAEASERLQPLRAVFERYKGLLSVVDVGLLAYRSDGVANILSARITCGIAASSTVQHDKRGWLAVRTSHPVGGFPALLDQIVAGQLELAEGSFRFPLANNVNFSGFRTHTKMLANPARPRATATCSGGKISDVIKNESFYRWRDTIAVTFEGAYYDVEALTAALELRQPLTNVDDYRQISVEIELPLDARLQSLTREKFSLALALAAKKPASFNGLAILRNDTTKEAKKLPVEVTEDGFVVEWATRTPPGNSNRIAMKLTDDEGIILEETFETHPPDSFPAMIVGRSEPGLDQRDVAAPQRTRIRASQPPAPGAELTGATIGPWVLLKAIGSGGYGTVYEAQHDVTHYKCAVKVIPYEEEDVVAERLKRETRASNEFEHPAIVPIIDAGLDKIEGVAYLAMKRLVGVDLGNKLGAAVAPGEAWRLLQPIFEVLGRYHESGVIHRDIHPGNIYLAHSGQTHLLDFGLCSIVGRRRVTQPATALGHLQYASPEQTMGSSEDAHSSADVWSLGVVLYRMFTGQHPFVGATDIAIAAAAARDAHRPASELGVSLPLSRVLDRCLEKPAEKRYGTATELAEALEAALRVKD